MKRIREQVGASAELKACGTLRVSAKAVDLPSPDDGKTLEQMVQAVADRITEMAMVELTSKESLEKVRTEIKVQ